MLAIFLPFLDLIWENTSILACALVNLALVPGPLTLGLEFVTARAELGDGLLSEQLLECPFLNILLLVLLKLSDELDGTLEDRALILLTARHNLGQLVDALVDGLTSTSFDYVVLVGISRNEKQYLPSLWLSLRTLCHSSEPTGGL